MIEGYIDDLFCCGYGEEVKNFCECLCICCEICKKDDAPVVEPDEELELPRMVPRLDENIPTARPEVEGIGSRAPRPQGIPRGEV